MSDRRHEEKNKKLTHKLSEFIQRFRLVFIILGAAVILFPIAYYVFDTIRLNQNNASAVRNNLVNEKFGAYQAESQTEKKDAIEKELFALIDETVALFPDRYSGIEALMLRADINEGKMPSAAAAKKKELYLAVLQDTLRIADNAPANILAPQAVMKAAALIQNETTLLSADAAIQTEELVKLVPARLLEGNQEKIEKPYDLALVLYRYVATRYPKNMFLAEALLNTGFILETKGQAPAAVEVYRRMESELSQSSLTKIAINRKLEMESRGLAGN